MEIWNTTIHVIKDCLRKANLTPENIHSIGITNQRETTVIWDKATGKPVYNAIVCNAVAALPFVKNFEIKITRYNTTKNRINYRLYFSATKLHGF